MTMIMMTMMTMLTSCHDQPSAIQLQTLLPQPQSTSPSHGVILLISITINEQYGNAFSMKTIAKNVGPPISFLTHS